MYKEKELRSYSSETYNSFYVNKYQDHIYYDDNLRKMDEYNYKLITEIYNSSISVIKEASKHNLVLKEEDNWIVKKLQRRDYSFSELQEIFEEDFKERGLIFNGYTIKDYFPEFTKSRKTKNGIKETYYAFRN